MQITEQDPAKLSIQKELKLRDETKIYKEIPYERMEVPPALEPGLHKVQRYLTQDEARRETEIREIAEQKMKEIEAAKAKAKELDDK